MLTKEDETKQWLKKLVHQNIKSMRTIIYEKVIKCLPNLKIKEGRICGDCNIRKHTKMPHKKLQHLTTSKVLGLLHMELMGPMQVESLVGKRYMFFYVDECSRITWIDFLREKSDTFVTFERLCQKL